MQPLDVCLNKPFKSVLHCCWHIYIDSLVANDPNPEQLKTATKQVVCDWIKAGWDHLEAKKEMIRKSFLICGISNALNGTQNSFIHCAKELPDMQLPYLDEISDDPFHTSEGESSETSEGESSEDEADSDSD